MTASGDWPDPGPLLHSLDAAVEIGDAEQQVIGRRDGGPGSFHDVPGSGHRRRRDKAQRPDRGSTIDCRNPVAGHRMRSFYNLRPEANDDANHRHEVVLVPHVVRGIIRLEDSTTGRVVRTLRKIAR